VSLGFAWGQQVTRRTPLAQGRARQAQEGKTILQDKEGDVGQCARPDAGRDGRPGDRSYVKGPGSDGFRNPLLDHGRELRLPARPLHHRCSWFKVLVIVSLRRSRNSISRCFDISVIPIYRGHRAARVYGFSPSAALPLP
jgi:hypothetical protein